MLLKLPTIKVGAKITEKKKKEGDTERSLALQGELFLSFELVFFYSKSEVF